MIVAQFPSGDALGQAARTLRQAGIPAETRSPVALTEDEHAGSRLPLLVLIAGLLGAVAGLRDAVLRHHGQLSADHRRAAQFLLDLVHRVRLRMRRAGRPRARRSSATWSAAVCLGCTIHPTSATRCATPRATDISWWSATSFPRRAWCWTAWIPCGSWTHRDEGDPSPFPFQGEGRGGGCREPPGSSGLDPPRLRLGRFLLLEGGGKDMLSSHRAAPSAPRLRRHDQAAEDAALPHGPRSARVRFPPASWSTAPVPSRRRRSRWRCCSAGQDRFRSFLHALPFRARGRQRHGGASRLLAAAVLPHRAAARGRPPSISTM